MGIRDYGFVVVLRAQRRAFQHWKINTPSAGVGEVEVVNGAIWRKSSASFRQPHRSRWRPHHPHLDTAMPHLERPSTVSLDACSATDCWPMAGLARHLVGTEFDFPAFLDAVRSPSDTMPPYGEELITDQAVRDILAHVRSLAAGP